MSRSGSADIRKRHIDSLSIFADNVIVLQPDEQYSIGFTASGRTFQLDVHLPGAFPADAAPQLQISPAIVHGWVQPDSGGTLLAVAPGLPNFSRQPDLGAWLDAIIRGLQRTIVIDEPSPATSPCVPQQAAIDLRSLLPDLNELTTDELQRLSQTDELQQLDDLLDESPAMLAVHQQLDRLLDNTAQLSDRVAQKHDLYATVRQQHRDSRSALAEQAAAFASYDEQHQARCAQLAPMHLKELLQIAGAAADADSDEHVRSFLDRTIDVQTFLDRYVPSHVLGTLRKAKVDRLAEQLTAFERATQ